VALKVDWGGVRRYWVEAVDVAGNESTPSSEDVTVLAPSAVQGLNAQTIYNNVLLRWTAPATGTLPIDAYLIRQGADFDGSEYLGEFYATFVARAETEGGLRTYWIAARDTGGNVGAWASVVISVSAPSGFVLYSSGSFYLPNATREHFSIWQNSSIVGLVVDETYEEHFITNDWDSPDEQISAGYPYYLQPTAPTAYMESQLDLGAVVPASRVTVNVNGEVIAGNPTYTCTAFTSVDGETWVDYGVDSEFFSVPFRYLRVRLNVTNDAERKGILLIKAVTYAVSMTEVVDSGSVEALSTDAAGTVVTFNKQFIDVNSIVVSPKGSTYAVVVYGFVDEPYPSSFVVYAFNINGNRISTTVSWSAKGL